MLKRIIDYFATIFIREKPLKERLFTFTLLVGGIVSVMGAVETLVLTNNFKQILPTIFLVALFFLVTVIVLSIKKIRNISKYFMILLNVTILPLIFILNGGITSGASVWLALGIVCLFILFEGKELVFLCVVTVCVDCALYVISYYRPEFVADVPDNTYVHVDSLFAVLLVGFALGMVILFQRQVYNTERTIAYKQNQELELLEQERSKFFASMSHELRTPINSIILLDEMIMREKDVYKIQQYAVDVKNVSSMLLSLINDILDFSQLENDKMEIKPHEYDTVEMIKELVDMTKTRAEDKGLEFNIQVANNLPKSLNGDKKRIQQIILNILTNAVKYTKEGNVTFTVYAENVNDEKTTLIITVSDTGIGIKKDNLEKLYDYYQRIENDDERKIEGSGLGLAIVKQLIDLMGGKITVDSIYTKGSVFKVVLDQEIIDGTPIGEVVFDDNCMIGISEYEPLFKAPEAKILVVDDNKMNADLAAALLSKCSDNIDTVYSGEETLSATMKKAYNVIFLDYHLEDTTGTEILNKIRNQKNGLCRNSRIILSSAEADALSMKFCDENGFDGYIEKPVVSERMERVLYDNLPPEIIEESRIEQVARGTSTISAYYKKRKICVTTDCVGDISEEIAEEYGIKIMYLYLKTKNGRFADTIEISSDSVGQFVSEEKQNARVDSATVSEYEDFFSDALLEAENVIHISVARQSGKSFEAAANAARCFENVHIIDSNHISCGQALAVLSAVRLVEEGNSVDDVIEKVYNIRNKIDEKFILPSVNVFMRNGYTERGIAKFAELINAHPMIKCVKGKIDVVGMYNGNLQVAWAKFIKSRLKRNKNINRDVVYISHVACNETQIEFIKNEIAKYVEFEKVVVQKSSFTCACNTGQMTFGFAFFREK